MHPKTSSLIAIILSSVLLLPSLVVAANPKCVLGLCPLTPFEAEIAGAFFESLESRISDGMPYFPYSKENGLIEGVAALDVKEGKLPYCIKNHLKAGDYSYVWLDSNGLGLLEGNSKSAYNPFLADYNTHYGHYFTEGLQGHSPIIQLQLTASETGVAVAGARIQPCLNGPKIHETWDSRLLPREVRSDYQAGQWWHEGAEKKIHIYDPPNHAAKCSKLPLLNKIGCAITVMGLICNSANASPGEIASEAFLAFNPVDEFGIFQFIFEEVAEGIYGSEERQRNSEEYLEHEIRNGWHPKTFEPGDPRLSPLCGNPLWTGTWQAQLPPSIGSEFWRQIQF